MIFETQQQAQEYIEQVNALLGYPDRMSGTLTYAIPQEKEDGTWFVPKCEQLIQEVL